MFVFHESLIPVRLDIDGSDCQSIMSGYKLSAENYLHKDFKKSSKFSKNSKNVAKSLEKEGKSI